MKRPIDPNLDNLFDDLLSSSDAPSEERASEFSSNIDTDKKRETKSDDFKIAEHSEHHHHHHSSGEHHHSSSGEHHHSGSEHHHSSSGEHHHSGGEHSHHHSESEHHHHSSSSHSSHHHSSKKKKKKKLSTAAKIAIAFLLIILLLIFGVVFAFLFIQNQGKNDLKSTGNAAYQETIEYKGDTYTYNDDIVSIAFIGVDKRELGADENIMGTAGQADTDILLTINTKTGKAKAIAIPRDTMVDVDVYSESGIFLNSKPMQLCLSYAFGDGRASSAENVTTSISRILYNVPVNKYFVLDLDGIEAINDSIGGVTLTSLSDIKKFDIKKGQEVHLVGGMTEAYVRTRDMDSVEASLERTQRQVQYIKAFTSQLAPKVLNDFSVVSKLYNTATDYSSTDISLSNATYLATLLLSKGVTSFDTTTIKGEMKLGTTTTPDKAYAEFYPDEDELMQVVVDTFYTKTNK